MTWLTFIDQENKRRLMENTIYANGLDVLKDELVKLKTEDRPNVIKAIAEAREHGDLSENVEYHAAQTVSLYRRTCG